jgi:hypothetical protein
MPDYIDLANRAFSCRIGTNAEGEGHRAGYNGVWQLVPAGMTESLFVPGIAGLNLEHYFDGWHNGRREIFFEPRVAPMRLEQPEAGKVVLRQAETPFWGVESVTTFTLREPNALDLEFRCTPRRAVFNDAVMGVFWASYIQKPEDNAIHFPGRSADGAAGWLRFASPVHGQESSIRGRCDTVTLRIAEGMGDKLFSTVAPVRWERPYYYGRWRDRVYLVMFRTRELLRFGMSPSGGGAGNPAWDFQILVPGVQPGQEVRLEARCIVDSWQGRGWVEEQARAWL